MNQLNEVLQIIPFVRLTGKIKYTFLLFMD